jgi:hypothetical protein
MLFTVMRSISMDESPTVMMSLYVCPAARLVTSWELPEL